MRIINLINVIILHCTHAGGTELLLLCVCICEFLINILCSCPMESWNNNSCTWYLVQGVSLWILCVVHQRTYMCYMYKDYDCILYNHTCYLRHEHSSLYIYTRGTWYIDHGAILITLSRTWFMVYKVHVHGSWFKEHGAWNMVHGLIVKSTWIMI